MAENNYKIISLLKADLLYAYNQTYYYYTSQGLLEGNDEELNRIWVLYSEIRKKLLNLDKETFSVLREISQPETDKSDTYYAQKFGGIYDNEKHLKPLLNEENKAMEYLKIIENERITKSKKIEPFHILELLAKRFHKVARQLRTRHTDRTTISIEDEYDVQDLLYGLLNIYFDDIRPEEWTPSYAGSSSRMDFLLKNEKIVIETKKTRKNLKSKEIGEQLIVDIAKYQSHPDCNTIFCFVYDPEGWISNPTGIEKDLSKVHGKITVKVVIEPK